MNFVIIFRITNMLNIKLMTYVQFNFSCKFMQNKNIKLRNHGVG